MNKILRLPAVIEKTGYSGSSIHRKEKAGEFPHRVRLGPNAVGWYEHDIDEWIDRLARGGCEAPHEANAARRAACLDE